PERSNVFRLINSPHRILLTRVTGIFQKRVFSKTTRAARAGDCAGFLLQGPSRVRLFPTRSQRDTSARRTAKPATRPQLCEMKPKRRSPASARAHASDAIQTGSCRKRTVLFRDCYLQ